MDEKPAPRTIPVRQLKVKPIYSTLREHTWLAAGFGILALAGDLGSFAALIHMHKEIPGLFFPGRFVLMAALSLVYLLFYKRYHYKILAEDGLYFVRKGGATHIPWGMIKSARTIHKGIASYIQVDVDADQSTMWIFASAKERLFSHQPKTEACFLRHMNVSGLGK